MKFFLKSLMCIVGVAFFLWLVLASIGFSAETVGETSFYPVQGDRDVFAKMPSSTKFNIIECFDTGSDFYYKVRLGSGVEGYIYELNMRYERRWGWPGAKELMISPVAKISCLTMSKNWGV